MQSANTKKVIFIDRDGVINEDPIGDYIKKWADFRFLPGALGSMKRLSRSGFDIVIISNQAGIGDGIFSEDALREITQNMLAEFEKHEVRILGIYYCLHGKEANCDCRKPKTGLFRQAAQEITFEASKTFFIGDKASYMEAGRNFGLRTLFVLTGHGAKDQFQFKNGMKPERIFPSLSEAVDYVLKEIPK